MIQFASPLLAWYSRNKRILPWRDDPDPYKVWVSEIMLQQTRVETVIPYFKRWIRRFPSIRRLAQASQQDVLSKWEGLGYYSRARNLHQAAQIVMEQYNGELPRDVFAIRSLPGIGRYTAGAIASIAFGLDEPLLDANVRRVLSRVFALRLPVDSSAGQKVLWGIATEHLPRGKSSDYNQALMDLGATVCVPKNPHCEVCPLSRLCLARELGLQGSLPILKARKSPMHYVLAAAVIKKRGRVLLSKRPVKGLLGGLWEFPNVRVAGDPKKSCASAILKNYQLKVKGRTTLKIIQHVYTHFSVTVHAIACDLISNNSKESPHWVPLAALDDYPMGKVDRQIARILV
jgi:A/G-specific adenine glycosylase